MIKRINSRIISILLTTSVIVGCNRIDEEKLLGKWQYYNSESIFEIWVSQDKIYYWTNENPYFIFEQKCHFDVDRKILLVMDNESEPSGFPGSFMVFEIGSNYWVTGREDNKLVLVRIGRLDSSDLEMNNSMKLDQIAKRHGAPRGN